MKRSKPMSRRTPLAKKPFKSKPKKFPPGKSPSPAECAAQWAAKKAKQALKRSKLVRKVRPKKNAKMYAEWSSNHRHCQCCGIGAELASFVRWPGLSTHHIVKPGRVHTETNLIRLCQRCHDLAEGLDTPTWLPENGPKFYYPKLALAHVLWMKREHEPAEYDPARLAQIHMRPLPEPEPPPSVFLAEWEARREGRLTAAEALLRGSEYPGEISDLLRARMQPGAF